MHTINHTVGQLLREEIRLRRWPTFVGIEDNGLTVTVMNGERVSMPASTAEDLWRWFLEQPDTLTAEGFLDHAQQLAQASHALQA
jgi:hypothetical protein